MKKILSLLLFSHVFFCAKAQQAAYQWAAAFGSIGNDYGMSITTDKNGNVYTTGIFSGIVDFNPGAGVYNLTSVGNFDIFVCKLNKSGDFIWAKSMGGANDDRGYSIAIDNSGNVYTSGSFALTADFDPGPNNFYLTAGGYTDAFMSKLDSAGNFIWAKSIDCPLGNDCGYSICTDANNNVYTTGQFSGTADFDPGPGAVNYTSNGITDIFISKLDSNGNFVYAKTIGGIGWDIGYSITADSSGNVYSTGYFGYTADFDPGNAIYDLSTTANQEIYILKLNTAGNFVWAKSFSSASGYNQGNHITLDSTSNVYTVGKYEGPMDFDPGPNIFNLLNSGGFISKLDSAGNFIFAKSFDNAAISSIALDNNNNIYTTGSFLSTNDFDPGIGVYNLTPISWGNEDIFISKLDSTGNFSWAVSVGSTVVDLGNEIEVDSEGNVLTTGIFGGLTDFNPGPGINNLPTLGSYDAFVLKLKQCFPSTHTLLVTACNAYTFNNDTLTSSGTYYDTLVNASGCDSIVILNLTINNVSLVNLNQTACISYTLNGQTYTSTGTYIQTYTNIYGCDSIITLNLTINQPTANTINQTSCNSYTLNGQTYNSSGTYTQTLMNAAGCDSVITLNLTINLPTANTITQTACNTYTLNGQTYNTSGTYTQTLTNAAGCDSVLKLNLTINLTSTITLTQTTCNSYTLNGQTYNVSGTYTQTFTNAVNCDSIIILNLTVYTVNTSVTQNGATLSSNENGATYQWVHCPNYAIISGANNQIFNATSNGDYAVIVTNNNCVDTSICIPVVNLSINNLYTLNGISISPNPTHGIISLTSNIDYGLCTVNVLNSMGQKIFTKKIKNLNTNLDITDYANGIYYIEILSENFTYRTKILKN